MEEKAVSFQVVQINAVDWRFKTRDWNVINCVRGKQATTQIQTKLTTNVMLQDTTHSDGQTLELTHL